MSPSGAEEIEELKLTGKTADDLSDDSGVPSDDANALNSNQEDSQGSSSLSENDKASKGDSGTVSPNWESESQVPPPSLNLRRILKRNLEEDNCSEEAQEPRPKKKKKAVVWDEVTIYYFSRTQGFTSVPSQGGSTLGMAKQHNHQEKLSLNEHADKLKNLHKNILSRLRCKNNPRSSASDDSEGEKGEYADDSDISDSDLENQFFLQPVSIRKRRAMLRASGVKKIDSHEKEECRNIRSSREFCGCDCKIICDPATCLCSQADIKCQVDRMSFPCGCTRNGCGNTTGRIEFNPSRVRSHFIRKLVDIETARKLEAQTKWKSNAENSLPNHHIYFGYDNAANYSVDSGTVNYSSISANSCHQMNFSTSSLAPPLSYSNVNHKVANPDSGQLMVFNQGNSGENHSVHDDSYDVYGSPYSPDGSSYSETSECSSELVPPSRCESSMLSSGTFANQYPSGSQSVDYLSPASSVFNPAHGEEEEQKYTDLSAATPSTTKYEPLSEMYSSSGSTYLNRPNNSFMFSQHDPYSIIDDKQSNPMFNSASIKLGEIGKPVSNYSSSGEELVIVTSTSDSSDNFGEIIKKTMVETVSA